MQKSPFKFLDSFTKDDREIFFGRDKEIEEIHSRVFESKILLVYGTSGTGKSSLINCGLANKFSDSDWLPVNIRRGTDINYNLIDALSKNALTKTPFERAGIAEGKPYNLDKLLRSVYLDHFKPIFLIFDQFEELFIFGQKEEKNELIKNVARVIDSDIQCRFIFSIREEYLAGVTEFEKSIPTFLSNRIRIEKMTRQNAIQTIEGPCRVNNIGIESGFAEALLNKLNPDSPEVELTWLQVFLDKIMQLAAGEDHTVKEITNDLLHSLGDVKDILGGFLEEQISRLSDPETGLVLLKSFVSVKGTKARITEEEVIEYTGTFGKQIDSEVIKELIQKFIGLRILRDKDEDGRYELRHDSLASKIFEKITLVEKELLEIKYFIENAYANYEKRRLLLSEDDLKYIAPYEDKLFLNEKQLSFISQSKRAFHKARRRRQNILIAAAIVIITVLSFFTIWAMRERGNAIIQQQVAENRKNAALKAKEEADAARQEAIVLRQKADSTAVIAFAARNQSDIARKEALAARESALQQKSLAEKMSLVASEQATKAEQERQAADHLRILAQAAEEKATMLSRLSKAQNLALQSLNEEQDPFLMGRLAILAYSLNLHSGGVIDDPVIFKALDKAYIALDSSKHSIYKGSVNEIRSMAENMNGLVSADMDGNILQWDLNGNKNSLINTPLPSYIDFISLSPGGDKIVTCYENKKVILKNLDQNGIGSEFNGLISPIRNYTWSNDGIFFASTGRDSVINIWNTSNQTVVVSGTIKAGSAVISLVFCNNDTLISAHEDGTINLWNIKNSNCTKLYIVKGGRLSCLAWNRSKNTLVAGCSNGSFILIPLNPAKENFEYSFSTAGISNMVFNLDFSLLAVSSWDKVIRLYKYHEFFEVFDAVGGVIDFDYLDSRARSMVFTRDNRLVAGMSDKTIRIWETSSQKLVSKICELVKSGISVSEWNYLIGDEIPYENNCENIP